MFSFFVRVFSRHASNVADASPHCLAADCDVRERHASQIPLNSRTPPRPPQYRPNVLRAPPSFHSAATFTDLKRRYHGFVMQCGEKATQCTMSRTLSARENVVCASSTVFHVHTCGKASPVAIAGQPSSSPKPWPRCLPTGLGFGRMPKHVLPDSAKQSLCPSMFVLLAHIGSRSMRPCKCTGDDM